MDNSQKIKFLRAKVKAIAESGALSPTDAKGLIDYHEQCFVRLERKSKPIPRLNDLDSELEVRLRMAFRDKEEAEAIRRSLKSAFGFSSLASTPDTVAKRVLKRGKIVTAKEAEIIRDFLTEDSSDSILGTAEATMLDGLLAAWERG